MFSFLPPVASAQCSQQEAKDEMPIEFHHRSGRVPELLSIGRLPYWWDSPCNPCHVSPIYVPTISFHQTCKVSRLTEMNVILLNVIQLSWAPDDSVRQGQHFLSYSWRKIDLTNCCFLLSLERRNIKYFSRPCCLSFRSCCHSL